MNRIAPHLILLYLSGFYCLQFDDTCSSGDYECKNTKKDKIGTLVHGKCQTSNILLRLHDISMTECVRECFNTASCTGINYRKSWQICDVVGSTATSLFSETGCLFSNISTWYKAFGGKCSEHNCKAGMKCVFKDGRKSCKDAYCKDLPVTFNADCIAKFGLYRNLKHGLRFQCHDGFEMVGRPFSVCQENGTWINKFCCKPIKCYKDCSDLPKGSCSGVYVICPVSAQSVSVYCDMVTDGGGWTVFQRRLDGTTDFYRNWTSYEDGFGQASKEYWLGNKLLNVLTFMHICELYIELEDFDGNFAYAKYSSFRIGDATTNYKLEVGGYSGTAGDSLTFHNNMAFTTYTNDNDSHDRNCAVMFKGAWWYKACHQSNLNGAYLGGNHSSYADGVNWKTWRGYYYSLKTTKMMFRKTN